jgi:adenosylcobinamide-GDP ribazoletransferase
MQIDIDQTHWYDRIWAALIFFTRLPFWRLHQPPKECYQTVVEHWPLAGWITGGTMAATLYFGSWYLPYPIAVLLAIVVRLLVTGALHEDGLADFLDGFGGGGSNRERILAIMKDSHIGTYGVIGLIFYELLLATVLLSMTPELAALTILAADPYSKMVTSQLITMMPYARSEEEAKKQNRLSQNKLASWCGISHPRSTANGSIYLVYWHALGFDYLHPRSRYVFSLSAYLAQDSRIHRRLLRSSMPVG